MEPLRVTVGQVSQHAPITETNRTPFALFWHVDWDIWTLSMTNNSFLISVMLRAARVKS
jgi:hypothetical protein